MITGLLFLLFGVVVHIVFFFGARWLVARSAGIGRVPVVFAIEPQAWAGIGLGRRALFTFAGPFGSYLVAVLFFSLGSMLSGEASLDETSMRVTVRAGGPAAEAGMQDGDRVVSVDGKPIHDWDGLKREMGAHRGVPTPIVVARGSAELRLEPTPSADGKIGVVPPISVRSIGAGAAIARGVVGPFAVISSAVKGLLRMLTRTEKVELAGPVEIVSEVGTAQQSRLGAVLRFLGGLSSYFLFVPVVLALVFFPRSKRR